MTITPTIKTAAFLVISLILLVLHGALVAVEGEDADVLAVRVGHIGDGRAGGASLHEGGGAGE